MKYRIPVALTFVLIAGGCAPLVIGGAVGTAAVVASQERGVTGAVSDTSIQAAINEAWFKHDQDLHDRLDMTIYQGRVLITGMARDEGQRFEAERLAWQTKGVKEVYNETVIDNGRTVWDAAKDTWITTQLETRLTFKKGIKSQNYKIDTKGGVVYLLGVAQSQTELDMALAEARSIPNVKRVVNYVKVL